MRKFQTVGFFLMLLIWGCGPTNTAVNTTDPNDNSETENKKMLAEGFVKGTIVFSEKAGDCPYTIKTENNSLLDPLNLEESFKINGKKIWVKYVASRRMNRCDNASPITISEIKERR